MQFKTQLQVLGVKGGAGTLDDGTVWDSCKVFVLTDLDSSRGQAAGCAGVEYPWGKSENFDKVKAIQFPAAFDATMEIITNGKTQKTVIRDMRPVSASASK